MYGHAIAALIRRGVISGHWSAARAGLRFSWSSVTLPASGLITVVHPWDRLDDSPRWDHYCPVPTDLGVAAAQIDLLSGIERGPHGEPVSNPAFEAAPVSFSALTVWNARELASVTGDQSLTEAADELAGAVAATWDAALGTWVDQGPGVATSGRVRTADALLALLVVDDRNQRSSAVRSLADPDAFGGRFGPSGVHPDEPMYDPDSYWRGPVWPRSPICSARR